MDQQRIAELEARLGRLRLIVLANLAVTTIAVAIKLLGGI